MADKTKIVRGYSLSKANVLWLAKQALIETVKARRGTVSASAVMDRILTAARLKDEKENGVFTLESVGKKVKG